MKTNRFILPRILTVLFGTILVAALATFAFSASWREPALAIFLSVSPLLIALSDYSHRRKTTTRFGSEMLQGATFRYAQNNLRKASANRVAPALTETF